MINIKPLHDRIVIEPNAEEQKTSSGIIMSTGKEKPQSGTVIAVGTGKENEQMTVKPGDVVLYGKYTGTEITIEGKEYLIIRESDIFAIV